MNLSPSSFQVEGGYARMEDSTPADSYPINANAILLPTFAALIVLGNYVPFLALYRVKNMPACTLIATNMCLNFFTWINAILWPDDSTESWWNGHGLCDIEVIIRTVMATLVATSMACLTKNLARAVDTDNPRLFDTPAQRRRRFIRDLFFVFTIPFLECCFHYVSQANRYGIITIYGCVDITDFSWPTLVIMLIWPPVFALLNCYYAVLIGVRLRRLRGQLSSTLSSNGSGYTSRRFLKLFIMSLSLLIIYLPLTLVFFYVNLPLPMEPYSWSRVHDPESWNPIIYFVTSDYPKVQYYGWAPITLGFFVVLYYGLNDEAIDMYRHFLCVCGLGRIWPSLKLPREPRRRGGKSWTSHLDLVGKALHYFDGRKTSQTSSDAGINSTTQSRKNSHATFTHLSTVTTNTTATTMHGALSPTTSPAPLQTQAPTLTAHRPTIFSSFRTHMHLPFPLFASSKPSASASGGSPAKKSQSGTIDEEAQTHRFSGHDQGVETNIWSPPSHTSHTGTRNEEGPRAYRERERRELEDEKANGGIEVRDEVQVEVEEGVRRASQK